MPRSLAELLEQLHVRYAVGVTIEPNVGTESGSADAAADQGSGAEGSRRGGFLAKAAFGKVPVGMMRVERGEALTLIKAGANNRAHVT